MPSRRRAGLNFMPAPSGRPAIRGPFVFRPGNLRQAPSITGRLQRPLGLTTRLFCIFVGRLFLLYGRGGTLVRSIWIFLARRRSAAKTPDFGGWISLDFLGFSRPKRDLSMGYAEFSLKNFSVRFSPKSDAPKRKPAVLAAERRDCSSAELNPISDFPQGIVSSSPVAVGGWDSASPSWPGLTRPPTRTPQPRRKRLN